MKPSYMPTYLLTSSVYMPIYLLTSPVAARSPALNMASSFVSLCRGLPCAASSAFIASTKLGRVMRPPRSGSSLPKMVRVRVRVGVRARVRVKARVSLEISCTSRAIQVY
eukprot:scaffold107432_cov45-Phaeocystis_antarctica.AAC.1